MAADQFDAQFDGNAYGSPDGGDGSGGRGCFFYGCLAAVLLFLLVIVGGGVGGYFLLKSQVAKYTAEEPASIPVVEATEEEVEEIKARVESAQQASEQGLATEDLVLTADEINALISSSEDLKGKAFIKIRDGQVTGDVSIPTDEIPTGAGRYLNASVTLNVSYENGVLIVTLEDASVKGEPLPEEFVQALRSENLAKDLYSDPDSAEALKRLESVEVLDSKIILKFRKPEASVPTGGDSVPEVDSSPEGEPSAEQSTETEELESAVQPEVTESSSLLD